MMIGISDVVLISTRKSDFRTMLGEANPPPAVSTEFSWCPDGVSPAHRLLAWSTFAAGVIIGSGFRWVFVRGDSEYVSFCREDYFEEQGGNVSSKPVLDGEDPSALHIELITFYCASDGDCYEDAALRYLAGIYSC